MEFTVHSKSEIGSNCRENGDVVFCDRNLGLFAIADGVCAGKPGERAARILSDVLSEHRVELARSLKGKPGDPDARQRALPIIEAIFQQASDQIYRESEQNLALHGMATTGLILAVGEAGAAFGHVGNGRAYVVRGDDIQRLTVDHTLAQEMLTQGLINERELKNFPHRDVLARAVGQLPTVRVDTVWLDIKPGDGIILCTDGMHRIFDDADLREIVYQGVEVAVEEALERGAEDNVSLVHVEVAGHSDNSMLDTQIKMRSLQKLFLFRYLSDQELARVLKIVFQESYAANDVIFREGTTGDTMYVVHSGSVSVLKGELHYTTIGPRGNFGEIAFMDGHPRSATVIANEPTTLLTIKQADFRQLTKTEPVIASKLLWCFVLNLSGRVRDLSGRLADAMTDED